MSLFLQLRFYVLAAHGAVLHKLARVLLPGNAGFILLVETDGSYSVARFRAEDGEDGALSSWHNGGRLLMVLSDCKENNDRTRARVKVRNRKNTTDHEQFLTLSLILFNTPLSLQITKHPGNSHRPLPRRRHELGEVIAGARDIPRGKGAGNRGLLCSIHLEVSAFIQGIAEGLRHLDGRGRADLDEHAVHRQAIRPFEGLVEHECRHLRIAGDLPHL